MDMRAGDAPVSGVHCGLEDWDIEIYNEAFFVIGFNSCMIRLEEIEFEY